MALTHVASGTVTNGTTTVSPPFNGTPVQGNLCMAYVVANGGGAIADNSSTWTKIGEANAGAGVARAAVFLKIAGASEGTPQFNSAAAGNMHAVVREFSGNQAGFGNVTFKTATGTAASLAAQIATLDVMAGCVILACCHNRSGGNATQASNAHAFNNGASVGGSEDNSGTSTFHHYMFAYSTVTTGNAAGDQDSITGMETNTGTNNALIVVSIPPAWTMTHTASLSFTGTTTRAISRTHTAGVSFAGAITRAMTRTLAGDLSFVGTTARAVARALAGGVSFTGSTNRSTGRNVAGGLSFSGSTSRSVRRTHTGGISFGGLMSRAIRRTLPPASLSFSGGITRAISRRLSAALSFAGSLTSSSPPPPVVTEMFVTIRSANPTATTAGSGPTAAIASTNATATTAESGPTAAITEANPISATIE